MGNQHRHRRLADRDRCDAAIAAIDAQHVARLAEGAREGIEDAAADADEAALAFVGRQGQLVRALAQPEDPVERERHRDAQRRRARKPGLPRHAAVDPQIRSAQRPGAEPLAKRVGHALHVVDPAALALGRANIELGLPEPLADHPHALARRRCRQYVRVPIDRAGQHQPLFVIGVLADPVDAPRRPQRVGRRPAERLPKRGDLSLFSLSRAVLHC